MRHSRALNSGVLFTTPDVAPIYRVNESKFKEADPKVNQDRYVTYLDGDYTKPIRVF